MITKIGSEILEKMAISGREFLDIMKEINPATVMPTSRIRTAFGTRSAVGPKKYYENSKKIWRGNHNSALVRANKGFEAVEKANAKERFDRMGGESII